MDSRSPLSHSATISAGFHSQKLWGLLFLAQKHWDGETRAGAPGSSQAKIPLLIFNRHLWVWDQFVSHLWLLLYVLSYRTSVQLGLRPSSVMVVLWFHCNLDVLVGRDRLQHLPAPLS